MTLRAISFAVAAVMLVGAGHAAGQQSNCETSACKPGDMLRVHSPKTDPAVACATKDLQRYVGVLIGLRQIQARVGTKPAAETEFTGDAKDRLDTLRSAAGVRDFEQASQACSQARDGQRVALVEADASGSMLVAPTDGKPKYWIDRAALRR